MSLKKINHHLIDVNKQTKQQQVFSIKDRKEKNIKIILKIHNFMRPKCYLSF